MDCPHDSCSILSAFCPLASPNPCLAPTSLSNRVALGWPSRIRAPPSRSSILFHLPLPTLSLHGGREAWEPRSVSLVVVDPSSLFCPNLRKQAGVEGMQQYFSPGSHGPKTKPRHNYNAVRNVQWRFCWKGIARTQASWAEEPRAGKLRFEGDWSVTYCKRCFDMRFTGPRLEREPPVYELEIFVLGTA
ncbi:hypothetical protein FB45DRAFT_863066 [Roridomyces roridus]|uniref:Uncharacterized protein n=1 Tax=Roridomyces roridus TaxID=1738132 RepID=A0AAD7C8W6_9AGAR|nr:hypothetical protein FB45DRAFT_863066 [Roridomyces roridus]